MDVCMALHALFVWLVRNCLTFRARPFFEMFVHDITIVFGLVIDALRNYLWFARELYRESVIGSSLGSILCGIL